MTEFNFDLESLSELGLAPELLQPKDGDLFLGLQDDMSTHNTGLDLFTSTNIKLADFPGIETTYLDRSEDLFSFLEMADIQEVSEEVPNGENILTNAIEESGIGSPTSSMGQFSPAGETFLQIGDTFSADDQQQLNSPVRSGLEDTQNLIDEVENYLKAVQGTSTIVDENIPITIEGNPSLAEEIPVIIQEAVPTVVEEVEQMEILPVMSQEVTIKSGPEALLQALATGKVALNDSGVELTEADLSNAVTTTMVTQDGQNVVIIIAAPSPTQSPASPAHSYVSDASFVVPSVSPRPSMSPGPETILAQSDYDSSYETDPDYSPSSYTPKNKKLTSFNYQYQEIAQPEEEKPRRKYQRHKKPLPPQGPYPLDKKERKKAQNRTAAFRYREKKKQESEVVEDEVSQLVNKNKNLKSKLTDVENELRIIKKLMTEAGLGKYARAAKI